MAANIDPIFPVTPLIGIATLTSPTAITSRANITGNANLTLLAPLSTNGKRVDRIHVHAKANTSAGIVGIWLKDVGGNTCYLYDELVVTALNANNTVPAFDTYKDYDNLVVPNTHQVWVSVTVANDLNILAYGGDY